GGEMSDREVRDPSTGEQETAAPKKKSIWYRLYHGETSIDFMGQRRRWFTVSGIVILVGLISLFTRGLNFGIDFKGGTAWEVKTKTLSISDVKGVLSSAGLNDAQTQVLNGPEGRIVRVSADIKGTSAKATDTKSKVRDVLAEK